VSPINLVFHHILHVADRLLGPIHPQQPIQKVGNICFVCFLFLLLTFHGLTGLKHNKQHTATNTALSPLFFFFFVSTFYNATVHNTCIAYLQLSLQVMGERGEGLYKGQSVITLGDPNCGGSAEGRGHGLPSTGPGIPLRAAQEHKRHLSPSTSQAAQFGSPNPVEGSARSPRLSRLETMSKGAPYSPKSRRSTAPSLY
jgi:hypothetical protein